MLPVALEAKRGCCLANFIPIQSLYSHVQNSHHGSWSATTLYIMGTPLLSWSMTLIKHTTSIFVCYGHRSLSHTRKRYQVPFIRSISTKIIMATSQSDSQSQVSPDPVTAGLLNQLREELGRQSEKIIFTCGGTIPIFEPGQDFATDNTKISSVSEPVTIRWDPASPETPASQAKLILPLAGDSHGNLVKLISDLEPASFGYHGKDVFDETYRKAFKMDTDKFASTFNPYECGIIDSIAQVLLPSTPESDLRRGVRAELYKLNVSLPVVPPSALTEPTLLFVCLTH